MVHLDTYKEKKVKIIIKEELNETEKKKNTKTPEMVQFLIYEEKLREK